MSEVTTRDVPGKIHDDNESRVSDGSPGFDRGDSDPRYFALSHGRAWWPRSSGGAAPRDQHDGWLLLSEGPRSAAHLLDRLFAEAKRFHSLPEAEKKKIPFFNVGGFKSGYSALEEDGYRRTNINIIQDAKPNLVAKFSINREGGSGGLSMTEAERNAVINIWPENLPGFKETLLEYHSMIESLGRKFLPLWAESLRLPPDYFDRFFETPHLTMSLLHYPPQKEVGDRQYGIAPHTDNSMMTFLAQGELTGLAVRMPSGHWRRSISSPSAAREHRQRHRPLDQRPIPVHQASGDQHARRRPVLDPVFFGPNADALIEVVPTCQGPGRRRGTSRSPIALRGTGTTRRPSRRR